MIASELPTRLVIDLPNWLGDQIMALPAVHHLVRGNAEACTVLHTRPATSRFLEQVFPGVVVVASARKTLPFASARNIRNGQGRFAIGITMRNAYRAKILLFLTARRTIGSVGQGAGLLLSESFGVDRSRHQVHDFDAALVSLGLDGANPGWRPQLSEAQQRESAQTWLAAGLSDRTVVGLAPATSSRSAKRWPSECFAALANDLEKRGITSVVVIGPGEQRLGFEICRAAGREIPIIGAALDVAGLAGVMARMCAVVSIDSGAMHLAAAVGTRVVGLFGPTNPLRTAPLGDKAAVVHVGVGCAPCEHTHCPFPHHRCMTDIAVEDVARAVVELQES